MKNGCSFLVNNTNRSHKGPFTYDVSIFLEHFDPPPPCQLLSDFEPPYHALAYPPPFCEQIFTKFWRNLCISTKILSNKYNYKTLKNLFQVQRLSILVYAFVAIAAKYTFLLTSSLVKSSLPHVRFCQHFANPPPPRVLTYGP